MHILLHPYSPASIAQKTIQLNITICVCFSKKSHEESYTIEQLLLFFVFDMQSKKIRHVSKEEYQHKKIKT